MSTPASPSLTASAGSITRSTGSITPWRAFPADPADWFEPDEVEKAKTYVRPIRVVNAVKKTLDLLVLVVIIATNAVPRLLDSYGWTNWVVRLVVALLLVTVVGTVVDLPFGVWRSLVYDRRWGFSTQKAGGLASDMVKGLLLGIVIEAVLFVPLWAIVRATSLWWVYGWVLFAFFSVILNVLFPVVIAPIFNKYTPLEDETLRTLLLEVAGQVDADISEYLVEDASKRDTRQNAYVAGIGKTRRVVIYDTMLEWPHEQISNVVAHEIGHWKLGHIRRLLPVAIGLTFVTFVVLKLVLESERALSWAGVSSVRDPAVFPLFLLVFTLVGPVNSLGVAWLSRAHERQADLFALETLRQPATFVGMMRRLHTDTLADLAPSLWRRISHSHPPVAERLAMGRAWGDRNVGTTADSATGSRNGDAPARTRRRPLRAPR